MPPLISAGDWLTNLMLAHPVASTVLLAAVFVALVAIVQTHLVRYRATLRARGRGGKLEKF